jgi:hypothetical protein
MKSWLFHRAAEPGTGIKPAMEPVMHELAAAFNQKVVVEDQRVCEGVQRGVNHAGGRTSVLSDDEQRVAAFHKIYAGLMGLS